MTKRDYLTKTQVMAIEVPSLSVALVTLQGYLHLYLGFRMDLDSLESGAKNVHVVSPNCDSEHHRVCSKEHGELIRKWPELFALLSLVAHQKLVKETVVELAHNIFAVDWRNDVELWVASQLEAFLTKQVAIVGGFIGVKDPGRNLECF